MKRKALALALLIMSATIAHAQPSAELVARINETAALLNANPGGYDTMFS
jgi:hypothetical protein